MFVLENEIRLPRPKGASFDAKVPAFGSGGEGRLMSPLTFGAGRSLVLQEPELIAKAGELAGEVTERAGSGKSESKQSAITP